MIFTIEEVEKGLNEKSKQRQIYTNLDKQLADSEREQKAFNDFERRVGKDSRNIRPVTMVIR